MIKLMKLELQRINLRPYYISSVVFCIILLIFNYFAAYAAQVQQETQFMTYTNIFRLTSVVRIMLFGILSATMYAKLIIEEYSGKRLVLLFSYPVSRKKIFAAKVLIVFCFVFISILICTGIPLIVFTVTESFSPIVTDTMSINLLIDEFKMTVVSITAISAIGLLSLGIGFIKKTIPITLISAFVLSGIYGNVAISAAENSTIAYSIIVLSLVAIFTVLLTLSNKINQMEAE